MSAQTPDPNVCADTEANDRRHRRARGQLGSVSLLVVIMIPALLVAAGLVLDGGRQLQTRREAKAAASAAARAAVQLTAEESFANDMNPRLAASRGQAELGRHGASGSVRVDGETVTVTVSAPVDYQLLPGGGSVTETATADPEQGVTG